MERIKWAFIITFLFTIGLTLSGTIIFLIAPIVLLMIFAFICVADISTTATDDKQKDESKLF